MRPFLAELSALTTLDKVISDKFMDAASFKASPTTMESLTFSEPARSTRFSLAPFSTFYLPSLLTSTVVRVMIRCERELPSFMSVFLEKRLPYALSSSLNT